jgi:hypothetical protein
VSRVVGGVLLLNLGLGLVGGMAGALVQAAPAA